MLFLIALTVCNVINVASKTARANFKKIEIVKVANLNVSENKQIK